MTKDTMTTEYLLKLNCFYGHKEHYNKMAASRTNVLSPSTVEEFFPSMEDLFGIPPDVSTLLSSYQYTVGGDGNHTSIISLGNRYMGSIGGQKLSSDHTFRSVAGVKKTTSM